MQENTRLGKENQSQSVNAISNTAHQHQLQNQICTVLQTATEQR